MPRQLELLAKPELKLRMKGAQTEPRLWIRRLAIWSEPGVMLREVCLRPGLNIVWSPDPADQDHIRDREALGHGSGKTLFCRLLRYCLGEDSFAPEAERDSIALAFPRGMVGAEILVNGAAWAVVRSLGMAKRSTAVARGDLDALALNAGDGRGIDAFLDELEANVLSASVAQILPGDRIRRAWPLALAWLARDQECRFDHVLEWRDATSDSGSPARSLSTSTALDVLRALLGALDPKEKVVRATVASLEQQRTGTERERGHREWEAGQLRTRIAQGLELDEAKLPYGPLAIEVFRQAAQGRLAQVMGAEPLALDTLSSEHEAAQGQAAELSRKLAAVEAQIPLREAMVRQLKGEAPGLGMAVHRAEHPICPVCEVPIDRALAEGCGLSHKVANLEDVKKRRAQIEEEIRLELGRLRQDEGDQARLRKEVAIAQRRAEELGGRLRARVRQQAEHDEATFAARRLQQDVERLHLLLLSRDQTDGELVRIAEEIDKEKETASAYRDEQAHVFARVSMVFDAVIRTLAGPRASGRVTLDGKGLHLKVELGGERSTAAIDSLKVLAFDLSAMCMSIEGATRVPAFLIHDSPREADLGLSAYHRLFHFARFLEDLSEKPLFQYIVTTTTRPPDELQKRPRLILELGGEPAEERLLRRDL